MAQRFDPWTALVQSGAMTVSDYANPYADTQEWENLATLHCEGRNQCVAHVLLHLQVMLARQAIPPGNANVTVQAAIRQMDLPQRGGLAMPPGLMKKMTDAGLNAAQQQRIISKCFTTQDAHCLPCQVLLNGRPIQDFISPAAAPGLVQEYAHLNGQFGVVHRMPTMFNETDSHAEKSGLTAALAAACNRLIQLQTAGSPPLAAAFPQAYEAYVQTAQAALEQALQANQAELAKAQHKNQADEVIYRMAKLRLLAWYGNQTEVEWPEQYRNTPRWQFFVDHWGA